MKVFFAQMAAYRVDGTQSPDDYVKFQPGTEGWECALVRAETFSEAADKFDKLFPEATDWRIERIGDLQAANLSDKWFDRRLSDYEIAQAKAEAGGVTFDPTSAKVQIAKAKDAARAERKGN